MKEPYKNLESLLDKINKSKLPTWVKSVVLVLIFLTPLIDTLSRVMLANQFSDLLTRLFHLP
jgi:hypothetical protein